MVSGKRNIICFKLHWSFNDIFLIHRENARKTSKIKNYVNQKKSSLKILILAVENTII